MHLYFTWEIGFGYTLPGKLKLALGTAVVVITPAAVTGCAEQINKMHKNRKQF